MLHFERPSKRRVGAVAISVVAIAILLEFGLHTFGPFLPGSYRTGPMIEADLEFGWRNIPGSTTWFKRTEYTVRVEVNRDGRLGPTVPPERLPGVGRVLLLGDSFLAAGQVSYDRSIAAATGRLMGGVEVVNDGVSGYGTDQELLKAIRDIPRFAPDVVALVFTVSNDVWNNDWELEARQAATAKPHFALAGDELSLKALTGGSPGPSLSALFARSALFSLLKSGLIDPLMGRGLRADQLAVLDEPAGEWERAWRITELLIRRFGDLQRETHVPILVVINPDVCQVDIDWCRGDPARFTSVVPQQLVAAAARAAGLQTLDLLPEFRRASAAGGPRLYYKTDLHWTEDGHRLAAQLMAPELERLRKR